MLRSAPAVQAVVNRHKKRWDDEYVREHCQTLSALYETRYWQHKNPDGENIDLAMETADASSMIESYQAALFSKNPSVQIRRGVSQKGDADTAQALMASWMRRRRAAIEGTSTSVLIYGHAAALLAPVADNPWDILGLVDVRTVQPWDLVLDTKATRWEDQRYVGYRLWLSQAEAEEAYPRATWEPTKQDPYLLLEEDTNTDPEEVSADHLGVVVYVLYDMVSNRKVTWSAQAYQGQKLLEDIKIPYEDMGGQPMHPLVLLRYRASATEPLMGLGLLDQLRDGFVEINLSKSFLASAIRRMGRQYLVRRGLLGEGELQQIRLGIDGAVLEVDGDNLPTDLGSLVVPWPQPPISAEVMSYAASMRADAQAGQIAAPFARGEPSKVTATEAQALNIYTASGYGRMAREKDAFIESIAAKALAMYAAYVEDGTPIVTPAGDLVFLSEKALVGDFEIYSDDQGSTPLSRMAKRQDFLSVIPTLTQLGVPSPAILSELQGLYEFSDGFRAEIRKLTSAQPPEPKAEVAPAVASPEELVTGIAPDTRPTPERVLEQASAAGVGVADEMGTIVPGGSR